MAEPAVPRWLHQVLVAIALLNGGVVSHASEPTAQPSTGQPTPADALSMASAAFHEGRLEDVVALLEPHLNDLTARLGSTHPDVLTAREDLAYSQHLLGTIDDGIPTLLDCLKARRTAHDEADWPVVRVNTLLGVLYFGRAQWDAVIPPLESALKGSLIHDPVDEDAVIEMEIRLASAWSHLGLPERGVDLFRRRLERIQERYGPDAPATFVALSQLTQRMRDLGDPADAELALVEGLSRTEAVLGTDHPASRRMRIDLARAQQDQLRFSEALTTLRPALDGIDVDRHGLEGVVDAHLTLAEILERVGDAGWREWIDRAVQIVKAHEGNDSVELARLYQVVVVRAAQKHRLAHDGLFPLATEVIRLRRLHSGPAHPTTIEAELQLVRLQVGAGRLAEARVGLERVTAHAEAAGDIASMMLQLRLADLLFDEGDLEAALDVRRAIARRLPLFPAEVVGVAGILNDLSLCWTLLRMDRAEEARPIMERSMAAINEELLEGLTQNGEAALIHLIQQWDVALHLLLSVRQEPAFDLQNWEELLVWRGLGPRLLAHRAQGVRADPELWTIYKERSALRRELADRIGQLNPSTRPDADAPDQVDAQRAEADRLEEEILARLGAPPTPEALAPGVADLCAALPKRASLVHFVTWNRLGQGTGGTSNYDAFILSGRDCSVTRVPLGAGREIDARIQRWRRLITAQGAAPEFAEQVGAQVAQDLLVPLLPYLQRTDQLILVPEDGLALVAWGGLPHPDGGYLVEYVELSTVQDVSELLRPPAVVRGAGKTVLVGDVAYGDGPEPAAGASRSGEGEPLDRFACLGGRFSALPGTASELDAVGEAVSGPVQRLQGLAATPDAVREAIDGASHIHFATHGFFLDERCSNADQADAMLAGTPLARSGLALSGANEQPTANGDGLLSAEELLDLDLTGTELVVLSACDTGRGELTEGQGVMGLRWALSLAGARNQVVSLWPIPDAETSALMADFYQALGRGGPCRRCTVAGALRYAQRRALNRQRAGGGVDIRGWAAFEASGFQGGRR